MRLASLCGIGFWGDMTLRKCHLFFFWVNFDVPNHHFYTTPTKFNVILENQCWVCPDVVSFGQADRRDAEFLHLTIDLVLKSPSASSLETSPLDVAAVKSVQWWRNWAKIRRQEMPTGRLDDSTTQQLSSWWHSLHLHYPLDLMKMHKHIHC